MDQCNEEGDRYAFMDRFITDAKRVSTEIHPPLRFERNADWTLKDWLGTLNAERTREVLEKWFVRDGTSADERRAALAQSSTQGCKRPRASANPRFWLAFHGDSNPDTAAKGLPLGSIRRKPARR